MQLDPIRRSSRAESTSRRYAAKVNGRAGVVESLERGGNQQQRSTANDDECETSWARFREPVTNNGDWRRTDSLCSIPGARISNVAQNTYGTRGTRAC
jgi:hypothetical protein